MALQPCSGERQAETVPWGSQFCGAMIRENGKKSGIEKQFPEKLSKG
jgi:hypothetical protein